MILVPVKPKFAIFAALLIWLSGFVWGSIVFMTPALNSVRGIPYVSKNPIISFPLLVLWPIVTFLLARVYLKSVSDKRSEGRKLGIVLSLVNLFLDVLVLVWLLGAGGSFFASVTIWLAYLLLLIVPWRTGIYMEKSPSR